MRQVTRAILWCAALSAAFGLTTRVAAVRADDQDDAYQQQRRQQEEADRQAQLQRQQQEEADRQAELQRQQDAARRKAEADAEARRQEDERRQKNEQESAKAPSQPPPEGPHDPAQPPVDNPATPPPAAPTAAGPQIVEAEHAPPALLFGLLCVPVLSFVLLVGLGLVWASRGSTGRRTSAARLPDPASRPPAAVKQRCVGCGKVVKVLSGKVGGRFRCPGCGMVQRIAAAPAPGSRSL